MATEPFNPSVDFNCSGTLDSFRLEQRQLAYFSNTSCAVTSPDPFVPSFDEIRSKTLDSFGKTACAWQVHVCEEILRGDRDIISIAGTGMGKTLTFWIPLLFRPQGIQIIVTPLNILGEQNTSILAKLRINAIFISAKTATETNFHDIASLRYRVIIVNPEELMRPDGGFETLLKDKIFNSHLISIVIDEAHCISQWGSFRHEYRDLGRLRYLQRKLCPILATSATMSAAVIEDVKKVLHLREENLFISRCSTDRPNFAILIRPIMNPIYTYRDLSFVLCDWEPGNPPPPKFIIFFDNIRNSVDAGNYLRSLLPKDQNYRIKWFNSDMSDQFKRRETEHFACGETWGLLATDSFGMGMDLPDIKLIVQWRAPTSISTLWQRFGRCVRNTSLYGTAVLLAEKEHFNHLKNVKKKRKRTVRIKPEPNSTVKRTKLWPLSDQSINRASQVDEGVMDDGEEGDGDQEDADDEQDDDDDDDEKRDEKSKKSMKKFKKNKMEPAILDLLNAELRGLGCRRQPFINNFQNNKSMSLHLECDPSQPDGCSRCRPAPAIICCDLHNPELLSLYKSPLIKIPRQPGQSRLVEREMNAEDKENQQKNDTALRNALETWRRDQVEKKYGRATLRNLGPSLVMGEKVRDRIVDCARHGKIKTTANLERETKWTHAAEYGSEIIKIIEIYYRPAVIDLTASQNSRPVPLLHEQDGVTFLENIEQVPQSTKRQVTCSLCGMKGHTMRSKKKCPMQNSQKENVTPDVPALLPSALITPTHPTSLLPSALPPLSPSLSLLSPSSSSLSQSPSLSPIFASTLSGSTLASLSPTTIASLTSHLESITLSRQRNNST